jgi:hypothetical protein
MSDDKSRVNADLDKFLKDLLKEVMKKHPDPANAPSLTDKMKVVDRVLKWEAIKGKLNDGAWGSGFANDE